MKEYTHEKALSKTLYRVTDNIKQETRSILAGRNLSGYNWCYFENGRHTFSRKEENGYSVIIAKPEDLTNGNLEYFILHGISRKN